jgi:hypothetical protein
MLIDEGAENSLEGVGAPPLLLPLPLGFLYLRIDALAEVFPPFSRDLAGLGER